MTDIGARYIADAIKVIARAIVLAACIITGRGFSPAEVVKLIEGGR